jgi:metallo-beta-lactamase class B
MKLFFAAFALLCAGAAHAQFVPAENANQDAMYEHFKKAQQIAGLDLYPHFAHACIVDQHYRWTISRGIQQAGDIRPLKVMDNLYFIGQNAVSSWAIQTSEGLIIVDALNNAEEAQKYIVGGLRELGLDPAKIKYVVVTHAHGDHFGGTKYLKDTYGARILASKIDWDVMAKMKAAPPTPPAEGQRRGPAAWAKLVPDHDIDIADGQEFQLGDTSVNFYVTPGHTPGTLALIFKTTDHGEPHVAALYGSLGMPASLDDKKIVLASIARFRKLAEQAGVDTLIANHQTRDLALQKLEILRLRRDGDPNPFVIGKEAYLRYMDIQTECVDYAIAREGQM